ncbi:MAG: hypothetical protein KDA61_07920 [Planctomycetales bacterium]|nr:hypothetical protein [Planctomycetales bacterium]
MDDGSTEVAPNASQAPPKATRVATYRCRPARLLILVFLAGICLGIPSLVLIFGGDAREAGIPMMVIMGLPGMFLFVVGAAYVRLRVTTYLEGAVLSLPRRNTPWSPHLVKPTWIAWSDLQTIDLKTRANPYAEGGVERIAILRTLRGDFWLNSLWLVRFDELIADAVERAGVGVSYEDLDQPAADTDAGGAKPPSMGEKALRVCGWLLAALLVLVAAAAAATAAWGQGETRWRALQAFAAAGASLPALRMLVRYRAAR